jgi:transcriptional regulator with XRE-family HTH domain
MTNSSDGLDVQIGLRIRQCRSLLGISLAGLAKHLGVTLQQLRKYECGIHRISAGNLYSVAKVLGVDVTFFFEPDPFEGPEAEDPETMFEGAVSLGRSFSTIRDPIARHYIKLVVTTFADSGDQHRSES